MIEFEMLFAATAKVVAGFGALSWLGDRHDAVDRGRGGAGHTPAGVWGPYRERG